MINDTMITHTPETGYPVRQVSRRRRVVPPQRATEPSSRRVLRAALYFLAAVLAVMSAMWLVLGAASHVAALQTHAQDTVATASIEPWDQAEAAPEVGQSWATISIPAIGVHDVVVLEGTDADQINAGVGHYIGTEFPWDGGGNVALAGHRTGWGEPFHDLGQLQAGDTVTIETDSHTYTYTVTGSAVVTPSETWVLEDVSSDVSGASGDSQLLTLTTCEGAQNQERLIVWAELTDVSEA
jgi:sortase A